MFKSLLCSLTGKLVITIGTLMVVASALFWYFLISHEEKGLIDDEVKQGVAFGELVRKSTDYGMMTFHQPMIQHTVEDIGQAEGVIYVRIFDAKGRIAYSSKREEIGGVLDISAPACTPCHAGPGPPRVTGSWSFKRATEGHRILNIVQPIYNKPACYTAACHAHPKAQKVLGLVDSDLSLKDLDKRIKSDKIYLAFYILGSLVLVSVILGFILWNLISKPVSILSQGIKWVTAGDLSHTVKIDSRDEMGYLAESFNAMTAELAKAKQELVDWGHKLEKKVQEKTEEIQKAQSQLVHSVKLASLGRMAAGVAHELNSPLSGIITFGHLLKDRVTEGSQEREDIEVIIQQANRCSSIMKGFLSFARASKVDIGPVDVNRVLKASVRIVRHKADFLNIKIISNLDGSLMPAKADASQLQQVFLNMIINARDAMHGQGTLTIHTRKVLDNGIPFIEIEFTDTGHGISEENMAKLFEPFFTTKPVGKGTGLGLAVSHGIIQEHGGKILVRSKAGEGTSFFVRLPFYE